MIYNFLYTADSNYFNHMYLSIYSLLKNNLYPLTVHIIESGFTKEQMCKLETLFSLYENASFEIYSIDKLKNIMEHYSIPKWRGTDIANARLFSSEIIDVDKVLYIDCDTIISSSLKDVFNNSNAVSAVREINIQEHVKDRLEHYYNSGVLLFDYKLCAEIDLLKLIFDTISTLSINLKYPDQDILNLALNEKMGVLTPNYNIAPFVYNMAINHPILTKKYLEARENTFYNRDELISAYNEPKIFHLLEYVGVTRPWIKNNVHPFNDIYDKYSIEAFGKVEKENANGLIDSIITSISIIPTISVMFDVTPFNEQLDVKNKIKRIVYFNRK